MVNADRLMLSILPEAYRLVHGDVTLAKPLPAWAQELRDTDQDWMQVAQKGVQAFVHLAMSAKLPFAFETVFSHWRPRGDGTYESKIDLIREFQHAGYFVVLIFVGLTTADLSILRVRTRRQQGGHDVPVERLRERFPRTQEAIRAASSVADMTIMFDNSRGFSKAFTLARAQDNRTVLYDCRDARFIQDPDLLASAEPWLVQVAPLA